ncbi:MAG: dihydroxyacetone kinase subunit L [Verrucomicrobia bacterium Tous-C9LFEB]|nr:MAG: dihydroxyacetone kinase subunit L [Verrucomicrobia bacterium Tous-C9LFEB]
MTELDSKSVIAWLRLLGEVYGQKKDYLTDLDAAIGDADHGANMARGFAAVATKLDALEGKDIGTIFKTAAMTLLSTVGGASGPLYGSFFLQAASVANNKNALTAAEVGAALDAGIKAVVSRGKAQAGDKTMLDALLPALAAYQEAVVGGLVPGLQKAVEAAKAGSAATKPLIAKKGRASYLGERSAGHLDPGAESSTFLLDALLTTASQ